MLRASIIVEKTLGLALATLAGACLAVPLRAQTPLNPLRSSLLSSGVVSDEPVSTNLNEPWAQPRPLEHFLAASEQPPRSLTVLSSQPDQPEIVPAPGSGHVLSGPDALPPLGDSPFSQQLVHPWFDEPWFSHGDPNDPRRHVGLGQPLMGTSWRNRPIFFGTFVGGVMMDDIQSHKIYQSDTTFMGARLGWDFDHFWGLEARWAFARPDLANGAGVPILPASRDYFTDVSLVYYPFGDARWRPYVLAGLGFQTFRFNDDLGQRISEATFEMPLGFGVKYFYGPWFSLRFDFVDNLSFGNQRISGMNNVSLMMGAELRFGGRRTSYFPWHNNTVYW